ncbi:MAG: D-tyrosyl-tRNA(Tyr) deacylase [Fimbriimonadaceae bacterium]|nr:D-tyrosyl-tRNA(Tyr) deacylase [Fimbriimonadaceae bacterium]
MKVVVQRVSSASVRVNGETVGRCGPGYLLLVAAHRDDTMEIAAKCARRVANLRIMPDEHGRMNVALKQSKSDGPQVLAISQFTLYGDTTQRRPSFIASAPGDVAQPLFEAFVESLRNENLDVETGVFGANMQVELVNDGPVTVIVDES